MTALRKYLRLESSGLWRETHEARLIEVIVGLREATLVLSDPKTEVALTQWSLPAVDRLNPGKMPALYGVGEGQSETLEIDDHDMEAALETVRAALERRKPRPGRLRGAALGGLAVSLAALAIFWLPGKLLEYTAAMLPEATRAELRDDALADLMKLTGSPCASKAGDAVLRQLSARLSPDADLQILVLRDGLQHATYLPKGTLLLPNALLQSAPSPDALAGYVLAELLRDTTEDLTHSALKQAGMLATLQLLTQGEMDPTALDGIGTALMARPAETASDEVMLEGFDRLGLSSAAYAYALDQTGETTLTLIEADPHRKGSDPAVMSDQAWQDLRAICTR